MERSYKQTRAEHSIERLLDRSEVEEIFGVSKRFLELAVSRGGGPKLVRIGRLVRYRVKDVEHWIEQQVSDQ